MDIAEALRKEKWKRGKKIDKKQEMERQGQTEMRERIRPQDVWEQLESYLPTQDPGKMSAGRT